MRRAARVHKDIQTLTAGLLEAIDQPDDRDAFVRAVTGAGLAALQARASAGPEASVPGATGGGGPALTPADLELATRLLTRHIGPIARVVVKRAAAGGGSRRDFLNQVAQCLDSDALRERFLREAAVPGG